MRWVLLPACLTLFGCPPPPAGGNDGSGDPNITIVFPPQGSTIELDADCTFRSVVVVDIDNYDIGNQGDTGAAPDGHWHLQLLQQPYTVVFENYGEVQDVSDVLAPGSIGSIRAFLVNNNHQPIGAESVLEFTVADTSTGSCTGTPAAG